MSVKKQITFKLFLFLIFTDLAETFAQFCFKKSTVGVNFAAITSPADAFSFIRTIIFTPFLWLALISVLLIFITWVTILSKIDLSVAVPVCSFSYITVPLVSSIFLHEQISHLRWSGIFIIIAGVILVSASTRSKEGSA